MFFITFVSFVKSCAQQIWLWERRGRGTGGERRDILCMGLLTLPSSIIHYIWAVGPPYNKRKEEWQDIGIQVAGANQCWLVLGYFVNHRQFARIKEPPVPGGLNKSNSKNRKRTVSIPKAWKNRQRTNDSLNNGYLTCCKGTDVSFERLFSLFKHVRIKSGCKSELGIWFFLKREPWVVNFENRPGTLMGVAVAGPQGGSWESFKFS